MSKLILVILVFILVFKPSKLPLLITHLSRINIKYNNYKQKIMSFWQENLSKEVQIQKLQENIRKAEIVDAIYDKKD